VDDVGLDEFQVLFACVRHFGDELFHYSLLSILLYVFLGIKVSMRFSVFVGSWITSVVLARLSGQGIKLPLEVRRRYEMVMDIYSAAHFTYGDRRVVTHYSEGDF